VSGQLTSSPAPAGSTARAAKRRDLPILSSLTGYQRAWLVGDIIAGITLVAIAIPEQMATAQLAGMPVQTGLYAFIAGGLAIAIFGSSRQMSVGADSTIAPIFAAGVAGIAVAGTAEYTSAIVLLALMCGAILIAVGLLRMGWIADLLSTPVTTGFLAGIGITIIVGQLPDIFGVPKGAVDVFGSAKVSGNPLEQVLWIIQQLPNANWYSVAIAVVVLGLVIGFEKVSPKIPGALIGLIVSLVAVSAFDLTAKDVAVLGALPAGLPPIALPTFSVDQFFALFPIALTVVLVCLMQTAATSRSFADLGGYDVHMNRDFVALGIGSTAASLVGAFPVDSSPPRTAVVAQSGGKSQVSGLVAVGVIVVIVLFATSLLADLPKATLGAILTYVGARIIRLRAIRAVWPFDKVEFALAIFTLFAVSFIGTEFGITVAILLAILERTRLSARPHDAVLGRLPGTTSWVPVRDKRPGVTETPGVKVVAFDAPLYFANASTFRDRMRALIYSDPPPTAIVFDAEAVDDVDFTGAAALRYVAAELRRNGIPFAVARFRSESMPEHVTPDSLGIPATSIFDTIDDAVAAVTRQLAPTPAVFPAGDAPADPAPSDGDGA
jgi:high affinity sulfate transporter 1